MTNAARSCARVITCLLAGVAAIALTPAPTAISSAPTTTPQGGGRGRGPAPVRSSSPAAACRLAGGDQRRHHRCRHGTSRPRRAVSLSGGPPGGLRPRRMTDEAGRFIFTHLPSPADYGLSASHPDYLFASFNAAPGEPAARIVLDDAQWFGGANIQLSRPASLAGTVLDERGEPVVSVPVRILKAVTVTGQTRWATGPVAETDDRGMYRVPDLRPGTYIVHVPSVQITLADGAVRPRPRRRRR